MSGRIKSCRREIACVESTSFRDRFRKIHPKKLATLKYTFLEDVSRHIMVVEACICRFALGPFGHCRDSVPMARLIAVPTSFNLIPRHRPRVRSRTVISGWRVENCGRSLRRRAFHIPRFRLHRQTRSAAEPWRTYLPNTAQTR